MGAQQDATNAVREAAFQDTEWFDQASALTATTAAPTDATDGISLDGRSAFAFQVVDTNTDADLTIVLWGYANGNWGLIPSGEYTVTAGGLLDATSIAGGAERIYMQITAYTAGTVDLNIGVPKP